MLTKVRCYGIPALLALMPALIAAAYTIFHFETMGAERSLLIKLGWILFMIVAIIAWWGPFRAVGRQIMRPLTAALWAVFFIVFFWSSLHAPSPDLFDYLFLFQIPLVFLFALTAQAASRSLGDAFDRTIVLALGAAALLHLPVLAIYYLTLDAGPDFFWHGMVAGFTGIRPYNYLIEISLVMVLIGILRAIETQGRALWLLLTAAVVLWAELFWAGARGGFLAILSTLIAITILGQARSLKAWGAWAVTASLGAGISTLLWVPPNGGFGALVAVTKTIGRDSVNQISSGRIGLWKDAIALIPDAPLLGHGFNNYDEYTRLPGFEAHPHVHNWFVELFFSFGLIGGLAILALVVLFLLTIIRNRDRLTDPLLLSATAGFGVLLSHGLLSGTYYHVHGQVFGALCIAIIASRLEKPRQPLHSQTT